jgi:hypothetical protein
MSQIDWDSTNYIELRKSYEIDNCICLKFRLGFFRIDFRGFEKDRDELPKDFGKVDGVDIIEEI